MTIARVLVIRFLELPRTDRITIMQSMGFSIPHTEPRAIDNFITALMVDVRTQGRIEELRAAVADRYRELGKNDEARSIEIEALNPPTPEPIRDESESFYIDGMRGTFTTGDGRTMEVSFPGKVKVTAIYDDNPLAFQSGLPDLTLVPSPTLRNIELVAFREETTGNAMIVRLDPQQRQFRSTRDGLSDAMAMTHETAAGALGSIEDFPYWRAEYREVGPWLPLESEK